MFKPHTKFGKLGTERGNTCKQRKDSDVQVCLRLAQVQRHLTKKQPGNCWVTARTYSYFQYLVECMFNERVLDRLRCLQIEDRIRGDEILK